MAVFNLKNRKYYAVDCKKIFLLLAVAVVTAQFLIVGVLKTASINIFPQARLLVLYNIGALVLAISPLLILLPGFVNSKNRLVRINDTLNAIRKVNKTINRESEVSDLLTESCKILREVDRYLYVAIISYEENIKKVADSNSEKSNVKFDPEISNYAKQAREGKVKVFFGNQKLLKNSFINLSSFAIIPFTTLNNVLMLAIFSSEDNFSNEEIGLLEEVADDIGFAINKYNIESDRTDAICMRGFSKLDTT